MGVRVGGEEGRGKVPFKNWKNLLCQAPDSKSIQIIARAMASGNFQGWTLLEINCFPWRRQMDQSFIVTEAPEIEAGVLEVQVRGKGTRTLRKHPPVVLSIMQNICFFSGSHLRFPSYYIAIYTGKAGSAKL